MSAEAETTDNEEFMTHYLPKERIQEYEDFVLKTTTTAAQAKLKAAIMGLVEMTKAEAKENAKRGDCLLVTYQNKYVPFQILDIEEDKSLILQSFYLLESHRFDAQTNKWKDCELRQYLNSEEFKKKFDPKFIKSLVTTDVHTEDYVTKDDFWILSHEEVGFEDKNGWFKPNIGTKAYDIGD